MKQKLIRETLEAVEKLLASTSYNEENFILMADESGDTSLIEELLFYKLLQHKLEVVGILNSFDISTELARVLMQYDTALGKKVFNMCSGCGWPMRPEGKFAHMSLTEWLEGSKNLKLHY